jgi:hypothetical protein
MELKFIDVTAGSKEDRTRAARSHAAGLNRQKRVSIRRRRADLPNYSGRSTPDDGGDAGTRTWASIRSSNATPSRQDGEGKKLIEEEQQDDDTKSQTEARLALSKSLPSSLAPVMCPDAQPIANKPFSTAWMPECGEHKHVRKMREWN